MSSRAECRSQAPPLRVVDSVNSTAVAAASHSRSTGALHWRPLRPLLLACLLLLLLLPTASSAQRLFFSSYSHSVSGGVDFAAVQVFNPACATVDLSEFSVRVAPWSNHAAGAVWGAPVQFGAPTTLGQFGVKPICSVSQFSCTGTSVQASLTFSGSDAVGLFHNSVLIDVIGVSQNMDGLSCASCVGGRTPDRAPWTVAGVADATRSHALQRTSSVTEGSADWFYPNGLSVSSASGSQWIVLPPGSNVFGSHASAAACPSGLFLATCGTLGSSAALTTGGGAKQVVCPLDCLSAVAATSVSPPLGPVVGSAGRYAPTSPLCLSSVHAGVLSVNTDAFPSTSFAVDPAYIATLCAKAVTSAGMAYSSSLGASVFPASNRPNGWPYVLYTPLVGLQTFSASLTRCIASLGGGPTAGGFTVQLLNTTMCDATQCGGSVRGYCNQNTGRCVCNSPYTGPACATKPCVNPCYNGGSCVPATGTCSCAGSWYGPQCTLTTCACNNRGACDETTGRCSCYAPFHGAQCQLTECLNGCSGGGYCDHSTGTCYCDPAHAGEDCSLKPCHASCSGFGACDYTTGQCRCIGSSPAGSPVPTHCDRDQCPSSNANICSGHGVCAFDSRLCTCDAGWVGESCNTAQP